MTIEEKLQHFYDITVQEVQADAERELERIPDKPGRNAEKT